MAAGPGVGTAPEVYWNSHSVLGRDAEVHLLANKLLEERVVVVAGRWLWSADADLQLQFTWS